MPPHLQAVIDALTIGRLTEREAARLLNLSRYRFRKCLHAALSMITAMGRAGI